MRKNAAAPAEEYRCRCSGVSVPDAVVSQPLVALKRRQSNAMRVRPRVLTQIVPHAAASQSAVRNTRSAAKMTALGTMDAATRARACFRVFSAADDSAGFSWRSLVTPVARKQSRFELAVSRREHSFGWLGNSAST